MCACVSAVAFLRATASSCASVPRPFSFVQHPSRIPRRFLRVIKNPLRVFQTRETKYKLAAARSGRWRGLERQTDGARTGKRGNTNVSVCCGGLSRHSAAPSRRDADGGNRNSGHVRFVHCASTPDCRRVFPENDITRRDAIVRSRRIRGNGPG